VVQFWLKPGETAVTLGAEVEDEDFLVLHRRGFAYSAR
jgi:hypothetical protein